MRVQQPLASGALGVNYNGNLTWLDHDELRRVDTQWIRGFIDLRRIDWPHLEQDPNLIAVLKAKDAGFKFLLSLKWSYLAHDFPSSGSAEHALVLRRLNRLLRIVMGKVDILVIGNEPIVDSQKGPEAEGHMIVFYEELAEAVIAFHNADVSVQSTRLYMGALNRLESPSNCSPAIDRMLRFIASKPELDGVDLHPHMPALKGHQTMVDFALARIRPDQKFIATEFSLIWHWKNHMCDDASTQYCAKYGFPAGTKVHEVISAAMLEPIPFAQWEEFLSNEPWYMARRRFMSNAMKLYRATGRLEVATYSMTPMRHMKQPLHSTGAPWMLNGLIAPSTVQLKPDGLRYDNFPWAEEFRKIQRGEA